MDFIPLNGCLIGRCLQELGVVWSSRVAEGSTFDMYSVRTTA